MPQTTSPTVWRRRVATEMKRLRRLSGLSQAEVAEVLGCRVPKISLIESGQRNVREDDLEKLLALYDVPEVDRDYYVAGAKRAHAKGWWDRYDEQIVPSWFRQYVGLEQGADRLRSFQHTIFHGLLQTPDYATAILNHSTTPMGPERIRRNVAVRKRRQTAITRDVDPLRMTAIVDESVLRRALGGPRVMHRQLEHVARVIDEHPNVKVQVIPFDRGAPWEAYSIFSFDWPDDPGVVWVEHHGGGVYLESLSDVDAHSRAFERVRAMALSPEESSEMISEAARSFADR